MHRGPDAPPEHRRFAAPFMPGHQQHDAVADLRVDLADAGETYSALAGLATFDELELAEKPSYDDAAPGAVGAGEPLPDWETELLSGGAAETAGVAAPAAAVEGAGSAEPVAGEGSPDAPDADQPPPAG